MSKTDEMAGLGPSGLARQYGLGAKSNKAKLEAAVQATKARGLPVRAAKADREAELEQEVKRLKAELALRQPVKQ